MSHQTRRERLRWMIKDATAALVFGAVILLLSWLVSLGNVCNC